MIHTVNSHLTSHAVDILYKLQKYFDIFCKVHFVTKQNQLTTAKLFSAELNCTWRAYLRKYIVYNRGTAIFQIMSENPTK